MAGRFDWCLRRAATTQVRMEVLCYCWLATAWLQGVDGDGDYRRRFDDSEATA